MPLDGERIARNEQSISDLRSDIQELREALRGDHHRLREVESAVSLMIDAQKQARREEHNQYRRMEIKLQWLAVAVASGGLCLSAALVVAAFVFQH